jgi:phage protein D
MSTKQSAAETLASQLTIETDSGEVPNGVMANLIELIVDQHTYLTDMFTIRLADSDLHLLDEGPFDLGTALTITAENNEGQSITLMAGEVTALEPVFDEGMVAELVVRGYDRSHRLYREMKSRTFVNQKDSDLAQAIAKEHDLEADIKPTAMVYDHIYQHNQSDLEFLIQRAWRIGYECFVCDKTLTFRPPPQGKEAVLLTWGNDLHTFFPRLTLAEQVSELFVRGWDPDRLRPIIGRAQSKNGRLFPQVKESKEAAAWAGQFGDSRLTIVDQPVLNQAEADAMARARLDEISGAFIEAEGTAFRRPEIRAGQMVELAALGQRFSGVYLVTTAQHIYAADGLTTTFTVRGARTGSLAEQISRERPLTRWPGVVPALVTNTDDPQDWGRVKVKFPWLAEDAESDWARLISAGAGPQAGFVAVPDVGDEVLVAFEHGDFSRPYVLGSTWNGRHKLPPAAAKTRAGEKPLVRTWRSRNGHQITLYDDSQQKIEIKSKNGLLITLDDNSKSITISADNEITLKARGNLVLEAGGSMDLKANGPINVNGAVINLN